MKRALFLIPLLLFLGLAGYFYFGLQRDARLLPSPLIDKPAPDFDLPPLLSGVGGLKTADLKGQVSVVNVFASWCVPCRAEHPVWAKATAEAKLPIYGINWKDKRETAAAWLKQLGNPYTRVGFDPDNKAGIEWGVYGAPETYIIDKHGRVRFKYVGPVFEETLEGTILPLVKKLRGES
jgi:cytochrome c biogenesis protein CcmG, thiol:disulfide interchange protein DsbE